MPIPPQFADFWAQAVAHVPDLRAEDFHEAFCFGDSDALADELASLVLQGRKTATTSLVWAVEVEARPLPRPGQLSIVKNWAGQPLCLIVTTSLEVLPFDRVDAAFAAEEGEDDGTLATWRRNHDAYFGRECVRIGRVARPDMPAACERYRVVYAAHATPTQRA